MKRYRENELSHPDKNVLHDHSTLSKLKVYFTAYSLCRYKSVCYSSQCFNSVDVKHCNGYSHTKPKCLKGYD